MPGGIFVIADNAIVIINFQGGEASMPYSPDMEIVRELFEKHRQMMYSKAFGILHNKSDAEDAVQNAFLSIINKLDKIISIPSNERVFYIVSIIEHAAYDILRKQNLHPSEDIYDHKDISTLLSTEGNALDNIAVEEIKSALEELSDKDYSLLYLYLFKQLKPKEIAEKLDIPEKNIRSYIKRARTRLIKILRKRGIDYDD